MGPSGPLRPLKGSEVCALASYRVYKGYISGPLFKGSYEGTINLLYEGFNAGCFGLLGFNLGFRG